jgi:predicted nucleotidyltransferase
MESAFPTPYPEVNSILNALLADIQTILGEQFIGLYLYGSLAYGGFDTDSDVDFVVVTRNELQDSLVSKLQDMHTKIAMLDCWCATQLEGSYTPLQALQNYDPVRALHLHIDRGRDEQLKRMRIEQPRLSHAWWGGWVLLRAVLREYGLTLAGPEPKTLVTQVSPDELKQANLAILQGWATNLLENPAELTKFGYQAYTVLTLCRSLYTLEYGRIASKPVAADWAQERLGEPWKTLIEHACTGRHNPGKTASQEDMNGTLEFIHFTLKKASGDLQESG